MEDPEFPKIGWGCVLCPLHPPLMGTHGGVWIPGVQWKPLGARDTRVSLSHQKLIKLSTIICAKLSVCLGYNPWTAIARNVIISVQIHISNIYVCKEYNYHFATWTVLREKSLSNFELKTPINMFIQNRIAYKRPINMEWCSLLCIHFSR